ncbi:response regulator [Arenibacter sp. GZD96]|uniref:response regulator n=1 Tax=Aurantibrevibacter litoralis TaxID=3106030 RepID=UPI002AFECB62|nr:response regulator [Arenibacter sp. GZD-96]MEA1787476.1 response regulator [Arenibacter sp. GZD-96]
MIDHTLKSIFLVDDDEVATFLNKILIKNLGLAVTVHTAGDGAAAIDLLEERNLIQNTGFTPCLLILDINMPKMNGWQFLEAFDKRYPNEIKTKITIVMITVSEDQRDVIRASNNSLVSDYIQKPLSEDRLQELVATYFSTKKSE